MKHTCSPVSRSQGCQLGTFPTYSWFLASGEKMTRTNAYSTVEEGSPASCLRYSFSKIEGQEGTTSTEHVLHAKCFHIFSLMLTTPKPWGLDLPEPWGSDASLKSCKGRTSAPLCPEGGTCAPVGLTGRESSQRGLC